MTLFSIPVEIKHANKVVNKFHRHNKKVVGAKFCIGVIDENETLWGVAIVGRPIARKLDNGYTAEVLRLCVLDNAPKGCNSFLYAKCWQAWKAMGGKKIITYTLKSESGASLRGAGWEQENASKPGQWHTETRPREIKEIHDLEKYRWSKQISESIPSIHPKEFRLFAEKKQNQMSLL